MEHDVVVIGGGAAGLSAALVLARACRQVAVIDAGNPRNKASGHLHGYLSRDGMNPAALLQTGREEVEAVGGEIRSNRVTALVRHGDGFLVQCEDGEAIQARTVLLATGLRDELPQIDGVYEHWGDRVVHCPYCHGYEVRATPLGVVGGNNRPFTIHQASLVRQWSDDVVFFPNAITLDQTETHRLTARGIRITTGRVKSIDTDGDGLDVLLVDGQRISRSTVFVGPRFIAEDHLLDDLACARDDHGTIAVDDTGATSVAGVWTAGNISDSSAQLINAASAGSKAAIALNHYLLARDIEHATA